MAAAGCFLPLTTQLEIDSDLGTRHRAALGISDQSDALALVVSEETGHIAIAFGGRLTRHLDPGGLHALLLEVVSEKTGYPTEMLELSMELDADLGIDSIKRVEILSALQERLPDRCWGC